jgi:rRNA maturation protein Nop10
MASNLVKCPRCGWLHEAVEVAGGLLEIVPCPFQPKDDVSHTKDLDRPRGVVIVDIGEEVGVNPCDLSH